MKNHQSKIHRYNGFRKTKPQEDALLFKVEKCRYSKHLTSAASKGLIITEESPVEFGLLLKSPENQALANKLHVPTHLLSPSLPPRH